MNNYSNDVYDWKKEVVVVTGGSDGIGAIVVKLLAEREVKVAVLDVQELQFEGTSPSNLVEDYRGGRGGSNDNRKEQ